MQQSFLTFEDVTMASERRVEPSGELRKPEGGET